MEQQLDHKPRRYHDRYALLHEGSQSPRVPHDLPLNSHKASMTDFQYQLAGHEQLRQTNTKQ